MDFFRLTWRAERGHVPTSLASPKRICTCDEHNRVVSNLHAYTPLRARHESLRPSPPPPPQLLFAPRVCAPCSFPAYQFVSLRREVPAVTIDHHISPVQEARRAPPPLRVLGGREPSDPCGRAAVPPRWSFNFVLGRLYNHRSSRRSAYVTPVKHTICIGVSYCQRMRIAPVLLIHGSEVVDDLLIILI